MVDSEKVLYPVYRDRIKIIIKMVGKLITWAGTGDSNGWKETSAPVKDGVGEVGGVRTELSGEVFSPPLSIAQVFGVERGLVVQALSMWV